jgi:Mg2+/Co2+ transporter CorC
MVVVSRDDAPQELVRVALESGHSRFPVIGDSRDEVVGILLAKDLLAFGDGSGFSVRDVLRPPVFIPESKRLDALLKDFRSSRNHLAVVVDEYGGVAGMVTIEETSRRSMPSSGSTRTASACRHSPRSRTSTRSSAPSFRTMSSTPSAAW